MRRNLTLAIASSTTTLISLAMATAASAADLVIGNALIERSNDTQSSGHVFVLSNTLSSGYTLSSWSFFDNEGSGSSQDSVTPLLLEKLSNQSFVVRGVGTTRRSSGSGIQSFDFGLTQGTSAITSSNLFFGWKDGTNGTDNTGVIDYDFGGSDIGLGGSQTHINADSQLGSLQPHVSYRTYSVQASLLSLPDPPTEPPIPINPESINPEWETNLAVRSASPDSSSSRSTAAPQGVPEPSIVLGGLVLLGAIAGLKRR